MAAPITDRFDSVPEDLHRVGAHRAPARRGRGWIAFSWSVLAVVVLTLGGLFALTLVNPGFKGSGVIDSTVAPVEEAEPVLDPEISVTVLNGTPEPNYATTVGDYLVAQGWLGAELGVGSRAKSEADDIADTIVFYNDPANEGAARALVQTLGTGSIRLSDTYPASPITILVGSDLALPDA
ncbi:MAG: hypothetical protein JWP30_1472 [Homoserinimonas sp.]|jgi:hypothetical protein|nr:hypothetical protein [Homoserinimonas sp.]